jgi:hypothetical protein
VVDESPARLRQRDADQRLQAAMELLEKDPHVQEFRTVLDARLDRNSIRPLDLPGQGT